MNRSSLAAIVIALGFAGPSIAQQRVLISSEWGNVTAELAHNDSAQSLLQMLPLTIVMDDHMRQEKTGNLLSPLPETARQRDFNAGTLGLWSSQDFVIYYRSGTVPQPGIIILGEVKGDVSFLDRPGKITVKITRTD